MDATLVRAMFADMKTTFPDSVKSMIYKGRTAYGIEINPEFRASLSDVGAEVGVESGSMTVDLVDIDKPTSGAEIIAQDRAAIVDSTKQDSTNALVTVNYHFQKPVVIDPQEIG